MSVINTNYLALVSQNNLTKSQGALGTAIERLSSGLRINSAKDDAAGQAIANRFTANVKGLTQAARNANDGISIAQTTEGSLNEINNNLQRIRELSVQAANASNSKDDLASIQNEIQERLDEIDRVSRETQFNGKYVLGGDADSLSVQVGAHDNQRINIELSKIDSTTLGLSQLSMNEQVLSADLTETNVVVEAKASAAATTLELDVPTGEATTYTFHASTTGTLIAQDGTDYYTATYDADTNTVNVNTGATAAAGDVAAGATGFIATVDGEPTVIELAALTAPETKAEVDDGTTGGDYTFHIETSTGDFYLKDADDNLYTANVNFSTGEVTTVASSATAWSTASGNFGAATHHIDVPGSAAVAEVTAVMTDVNDELGGTNTLHRAENGDLYVKNVDADGKETWYAAKADKDTGDVSLLDEVVVDPLKAIDSALQQVDNLRSHLGAIQNRFESTIANLNNTVNNLSAARSRIEDADYAVEVSNMTRAQILQQAGTSVLAQANQIPQTVLSLLR